MLLCGERAGFVSSLKPRRHPWHPSRRRVQPYSALRASAERRFCFLGLPIGQRNKSDEGALYTQHDDRAPEHNLGPHESKARPAPGT